MHSLGGLKEFPVAWSMYRGRSWKGIGGLWSAGPSGGDSEIRGRRLLLKNVVHFEIFGSPVFMEKHEWYGRWWPVAGVLLATIRRKRKKVPQLLLSTTSSLGPQLTASVGEVSGENSL